MGETPVGRVAAFSEEETGCELKTLVPKETLDLGRLGKCQLCLCHSFAGTVIYTRWEKQFSYEAQASHCTSTGAVVGPPGGATVPGLAQMPAWEPAWPSQVPGPSGFSAEEAQCCTVQSSNLYSHIRAITSNLWHCRLLIMPQMTYAARPLL